MRDDAAYYAERVHSRMQHAWLKRPRDESDAHDWPADKQSRLAGRAFFPAASPAVLAGHATPASLSKARGQALPLRCRCAARPLPLRLTPRGSQSRTAPALSLLAKVSPSPLFGGALGPFRPGVLRPPPVTAPASLSKGAHAPLLFASCAPAQRRLAGSSNYADGFYTMSPLPSLPPLAPPSSGGAASQQRAPLLLAQQPPPPPLERGFAASKLLFGEGTTHRPVRRPLRTALLHPADQCPHRLTQSSSRSTGNTAQMLPQVPPPC